MHVKLRFFTDMQSCIVYTYTSVYFMLSIYLNIHLYFCDLQSTCIRMVTVRVIVRTLYMPYVVHVTYFYILLQDFVVPPLYVHTGKVYVLRG